MRYKKAGVYDLYDHITHTQMYLYAMQSRLLVYDK